MPIGLPECRSTAGWLGSRPVSVVRNRLSFAIRNRHPATAVGIRHSQSASVIRTRHPFIRTRHSAFSIPIGYPTFAARIRHSAFGIAVGIPKFSFANRHSKNSAFGTRPSSLREALLSSASSRDPPLWIQNAGSCDEMRT
jgi:hypothetical protein